MKIKDIFEKLDEMCLSNFTFLLFYEGDQKPTKGYVFFNKEDFLKEIGEIQPVTYGMGVKDNGILMMMYLKKEIKDNE